MSHENLVVGDRLEISLEAFMARAAAIIEAEQGDANPDNALLGFACDAIRLAREYAKSMRRPIPSAGAAHE